MRRLIVGCGPRYVKQEGDVTLDLRPFPNVDIVHDLNETPWPFDDESFEHVSAVHVVEHLDSLVTFMDEAWRVLVPGGNLFLETPLAGGDLDLEWADPTHRRCYRVHTFANYFTLQGVENFGYTERPWNIFHLDVLSGSIRFDGWPIKR